MKQKKRTTRWESNPHRCSECGVQFSSNPKKKIKHGQNCSQGRWDKKGIAIR
jgi:predicted Zn-ribbon and HTH transcriptional regulator